MKSKKIVNVLLNYGIIFILIILLTIFAVGSKNFLSVGTLITILKQVSIIGIISVGMTFVMLTGGIDLSVGSIAGVTSVTAAMFMAAGINSVVACFLALLIATIYGALNGVFVNLFNIPPLIATLGSMTSIRGLAYIATDGLPIFGFNDVFIKAIKGSIWIIPYPVIVMIVVFILGKYVLENTAIGRHIYGVGGNEESSRLSGVSVGMTKYFCYCVSGLLAGIAGLVLLSRTTSGQPAAGAGYEMDAITAVVLGGISITGGQGKLLLVTVGVLIMGVLSTGMIMVNINDYVQQVIKGLVLVGAVAFSSFSHKMREKNIIID